MRETFSDFRRFRHLGFSFLESIDIALTLARARRILGKARAQ